jgi:hypothetical protein
MKKPNHIRNIRGIGAAAALMLTVFLFGLLSGCASPPPPGVGRPPAGGASASSGGGKGEMPDWFLNPQSVYPDNKYMTALGSGDTRRAAEQSALGALSQRFEAKVTMDMQTQDRYRELITSGGGGYTEQEMAVNQGINVQSNQTLVNVQFGEAAVDEQGRVHVIAYLERAPTGKLYQELIRKNGEKVASFLAEAQASDEKIRRYAYLSAAATVAAGNEMLIEQLRIIAPGYEKQLGLPYEVNEVNKRRADAASGMKAAVAIQGDEGSRITSVVKEALGELRFPMGQPATIKVEGSVSLQEAGGRADFKTVNWVLALTMYGPDGSSIVSYNNQDDASGVSVDTARSFAYDDMEEDVQKQFIGALRDYFNGMVMGD